MMRSNRTVGLWMAMLATSAGGAGCGVTAPGDEATVDAAAVARGLSFEVEGDEDSARYAATGGLLSLSIGRDGLRIAPTPAASAAARARGEDCLHPVSLLPVRLRQGSAVVGEQVRDGADNRFGRAIKREAFAGIDLVASSVDTSVAVGLRVGSDAELDAIEFLAYDEATPTVDDRGALVLHLAGGQELRSLPALVAADGSGTVVAGQVRWRDLGERRFGLSVTGVESEQSFDVELFEIGLGAQSFAAGPGASNPDPDPELATQAIRCYQTHTYFGEPYCTQGGWERDIVGVKRIDCKARVSLEGRVTDCESYITDFACGGGTCDDTHFSCPPDPSNECCPGPPPGDPDYCKCHQCDVGESDCDSDAECKPGLFCRHNVGRKYGLPDYWDVCEAPCPVAPGHADYCKLCGPCLPGEGDCDTGECLTGDLCQQNVGASYGYASWVDVCVTSPPLSL